MQTVGLIKRLVVMVYDGLLLFSVAAFSSAVVMGIYLFLAHLAPESFVMDPSKLENPKITQLTELGKLIGGILVTINVLVVSFFFYAWFWTHGGQTLGMKAWNLYLIKPDGKFIDWKLARKRYLLALLSWLPLGLGYSWILLNRKQLTWHDMWTNTQIVKHKPNAA